MHFFPSRLQFAQFGSAEQRTFRRLHSSQAIFRRAVFVPEVVSICTFFKIEEGGRRHPTLFNFRCLNQPRIRIEV